MYVPSERHPFVYSAHPRIPRLEMTSCLVLLPILADTPLLTAASSVRCCRCPGGAVSGVTSWNQQTRNERRMYQNVVTVTMAFFVAFVFGSPLLSVVLALIMPLLIFAGYIQVGRMCVVCTA